LEGRVHTPELAPGFFVGLKAWDMDKNREGKFLTAKAQKSKKKRKNGD
jgi:hypothetical protein